MPLSRYHIRDKIVWHHTNSGVYLMSSGYKSARTKKHNGGLHCKPAGESSDRQGVMVCHSLEHFDHRTSVALFQGMVEFYDSAIPSSWNLSTSNLIGGAGIEPEITVSNNGDMWTRPRQGYMKVNCDAAWNKQEKDGSTGSGTREATWLSHPPTWLQSALLHDCNV
ncbi:hypothetical protein LIER_05021 [Lithospermum erythrorhizon]|uniref:N-acetylmuramoyl-L-alanine amidase domain-containing protein n=1 Tax=Lithospermum erythrorhizon TaxID=34254 RepID=A0AAV3NYY2_LITER